MKNTVAKLMIVACLATGLTACAGYYDGDGYSYSEVDSYDVPSSTVIWSDWHGYHHHRHHDFPSVTVSGDGGGQAHYGPPSHHDNNNGGAHYGPPGHAHANNNPHYGPPGGGMPSVNVG
ncbi:MAG: hypothetical protein K0U29_06600 [Gammaproteobacteria bacterium]|nr:hypothetical protein [Gammaproteobacteria bacterium]MCH9744583.1 hypothetical protein [Gammaproteobacteria bacterium]